MPADVDIVPIAHKIWRLYEVETTAFTESAANFFLDYGCRLTLKPISIQPNFPLYTVEPYIIRHDSRMIFFLFVG